MLDTHDVKSKGGSLHDGQMDDAKSLAEVTG